MAYVAGKPILRTNPLDLFTRMELAELPHLLTPGETVLGIVGGFYSAGTAILCVTTQRLLLLDKKLFRLSFEDVRFDVINEVIYSHQMFLASATFYVAGRNLNFRTWYKKELQLLVRYVQNKMFESRGEATVEDSGVQELLGEQAKHEISGNEVAKPLSQTQYHYTSRLTPARRPYMGQGTARWRRAGRFMNTLPSHPGSRNSS